MRCLECGVDERDGKTLSNHVKKIHKITVEDYTTKHHYGGTRPQCPQCGSLTRYTAFTFKKYCQECATTAMKEGGARGGKAESWNKGKTAKDDIRVKEQSDKLKGDQNPFYGKQHSDLSRFKMSIARRLRSETIEMRIAERSAHFDLLTPIEEYISRQKQYLQFKCKTCGAVQEKTLQSFERGSLCEVCYPLTASQWQIEVEEWIKSQGFVTVRGDRTVIAPKEIDILIPDKTLGIECHGLYYHSEAKGVLNPKAHAQKAEIAEKAGIRLLQIFQDEWRDRQNIVKGMILHRLGMEQHVVGARKCKVVSLSAKEQRLFFESSHLSGYASGQAAWALETEGLIVACLSVRMPRQKKWCDRLEVSRFAVLPGWSIPGSLSRLTNQALSYAKERGFAGIMTYVDKRVGSGAGYNTAGFHRIGETGPDYWYTDLTCRYDRFLFRAQDDKSEKQIAAEKKCHKIWGAGSYIFVVDV